MTLGIFVNGKRPKSKKEIKESLETGTIRFEDTSVFQDSFPTPWDGTVCLKGSVSTSMPENRAYAFVGPCPHTKRSFYGTIEKKGNKLIVK